MGAPGRRLDLLVGGPGPPIRDVVLEGVVEQERALVTSPKSERREAMLIRLTSSPSTVIRPDVTSFSRGSRSMRVVFPEPDSPTNATFSPRRMVREMSRRASLSAPG